MPTTLPRDVRAHAVGAGPRLSSADGRGIVGTAGGTVGTEVGWAWAGLSPCRGRGALSEGAPQELTLPCPEPGGGTPWRSRRGVTGQLCGECCPAAWGQWEEGPQELGGDVGPGERWGCRAALGSVLEGLASG